MAARIQSLRNGIDPVDEQSRNDLTLGDVVVVSSLDGATTYNWTLVYVPEGSTATFSGVPTAVSPGAFVVDKVGPYLVRLVVDQGLPSEDEQYVRLRALTTSLGLTLVSAGERRDGSGIIPVDIDPTGWADEQNNNLLALESAISASVGTLGTLSYNKNVPEVPNDSVSYRGWVSVACTLIGVRVRMMTVNTQGNYTLEVINEGTGNTVIDSPPFDMNGLAAGVIQPVTLTGVPTDLNFAALDGWRVTLTSDDPDFDGSDIYFELVWNTATAGGPVVEDLATTLLVGNITGGTNIEVTAGDIVQFGSSSLAPISSAGTGRLRYSQADTAFQVSVDGGPWEDIGGGGGSDDNEQFEMLASPGNTINTFWWAPYNATIVEINVFSRTGMTTAGVYTLEVFDETNSNNLLSTATVDMTTATLPVNTLTALTLTGTTADLDVAKGTQVLLQLVSDNVDLTGGGVFVQIIYRSQ